MLKASVVLTVVFTKFEWFEATQVVIILKVLIIRVVGEEPEHTFNQGHALRRVKLLYWNEVWHAEFNILLRCIKLADETHCIVDAIIVKLEMSPDGMPALLLLGFMLEVGFLGARDVVGSCRVLALVEDVAFLILSEGMLLGSVVIFEDL